jgi:hypothetical protein
MATLKPGFELVVGSFQSTTANPAGGPTRMIVRRDMDVPADALEVWMMKRPDVQSGDAVQLKLGHDGSGETVFTGELIEIRASLEGCRLHAAGTMLKLLNARSSSVYEGQSAGSVVKDLVSTAGASSADVSDGPTLPVLSVDRHRSLWRHARELADRLGYELFSKRDGGIVFKPFGAAASLDSAGGGLAAAAAGAVAGALGLGGTATGYAFGKHLIRATNNEGTPGPDAIQVGGESPASMQGDSTVHWLTTNDTDFLGSAGDGDAEVLVSDGAARTKDLADRFAAGLLATAARRASHVDITVLGRPEIELGDQVQVSDLPDHSSALTGYVRSVRHRFGEDAGFVTDLRIAVEAT